MDDGETKPAAAAKKKSRSPAYPYISLERAILRARQMYDKEGKHGARFVDVATHWSFKVTSSGAMQTLAALKQFGIVSFDGGTAEQRIVKLTPLGIRILLEEREAEHLAAVREAALGPKIYRTLWSKYGPDLPSDSNMASFLKIELEYNPSAVEDLLKDFKDTIAFAKLKDAASLPPSDDDNDPDEEDNPMEQELINRDRTPNGQNPPAKTQKAPENTSEREYFRAPLTGGRMVRVLFSGTQPTQAEINKLILLLQLMKDQYPESAEGEPQPT